MQIDIYSDAICPWCFIGKRRLERALAARPDLELEISWRPFQLNPEMPAEGIARQEYLASKFGGSERAEKIYQPVLAAAAGEKLEFNLAGIQRTPNTINAHRVIRFAESGPQQDATVEALFRAYFFDGRDIGDIEELISIGASSGLDPDLLRDYLESERDLEEIKGEDLQARLMGITGVPCFIVDRRYAISGAQEPEAFLPLFDVAREATAG